MDAEVDVTIDDWADWTGDEIIERHRCSLIPFEETGVLRRATGPTEHAGWILAFITPATEDDVRNGRAPSLGVPSRCLAIGISFCPFCGIVLQT
jgi:hypothetical protein